ncbi:MAG: endo alpha-1,4 polygalactosaminidase [Fidelibacterota bacterium]
MNNNLIKLIFISVLSVMLLTFCEDDDSDTIPDRDFKQDMRDFVQGISSYSKGINASFIIIPQNGHDILTEDGEETGTPAADYINAIDGVGREDLFYGYDDDNEPTSAVDKDYMLAFMDIAENNGVEVLVTDYCWTPSYMDDSYAQNAAKGYISFAADHRELDNIPDYPATPHDVNADNIPSLAEAMNFLYLLNPGTYSTKVEFLNAVQNTNYDLVIMDLFFEGTDELTFDDITSLKTKLNGGSRLMIAYMSIGEVEDYRYYWNSDWKNNPPSWLEKENPDWEGNYKVRYWDTEWQDIIFGNDSSYLKKILDAGFDGVYLDIIDAFEYFEGL